MYSVLLSYNFLQFLTPFFFSFCNLQVATNATVISIVTNLITSIERKVTADRVNRLEAGELCLDDHKGAYVNLHSHYLSVFTS